MKKKPRTRVAVDVTPKELEIMKTVAKNDGRSLNSWAKRALLAAAGLLFGCSAQVEPVGTTSEAITHSDGFGNTWTDSTPIGTHDMAQADAACAAFATSQGANGNTCALVVPCLNPSSPGNSMITTFGLQPANDVWGWVYAGPLAGSTVHVHETAVPQVIPDELCLVAGVTGHPPQPALVSAGSWQ
jgi:hypothetical protein